MPKLSKIEQTEFLKEPGVLMRIGVTQEDGAPLVTPIWFLYQEADIWFTPRHRSAWFGCITADPRVSLCIDEDALPYRKVLVQGVAECVHEVGMDDLWRSTYLEMATKYVGTRGAERYIADTIDQPRALFRVKLSAAKVSSWRMPVAGEPGMGIWAKRYYEPGTEF